MNNINWIFWIIIGATALQWVYGKVQEQAELNKARKRREQARQASLRSGPAPTLDPSRSATPTTLTQADLHARRQAQLRALRERQARATQPRATPTPPRSAPPPAPHQPAAPTLSHADRLRRDQPRQPQRQRQRRPQPEWAQRRAAPPVREPDRSFTPRAPAGPRSASIGPSPLIPRSREDWRRAIIASEILAPPVSLRDAG